jgi:two-component sensor histidine kinase/CheY-like chemotaxis protein
MVANNSAPPRLLLLEDSAVDAELIETHLGTLDPAPLITRVASRTAFEQALTEGGFDIILSDYSLPDFDGMSALKIAVERAPNVPFIFVSGVLGEEAAIEAFRKGATDYVLKQRLIRLPAAVERALKEAHERNERHRVEQQKDLLVRELSHRVKNNLAVILSIIRRTARGSATIEEFQNKLVGRIRAMADAHALLFEGNWSDTEFLSVFRRAIRPYDPNLSRFDIGRHDLVRLTPKSALSLGMIVNELVTNATKYGALSNEQGRVAIEWTIGEGEFGKRTLCFRWSESGGPQVRIPDHEGFGSTLVKANVEYELEGAVTFDYAPTGLVAEIRFPLAD